MTVPDAVGAALGTAGNAVVFAGATVVVALLGLLLVGIPFVGNLGVAAAPNDAGKFCTIRPASILKCSTPIPAA